MEQPGNSLNVDRPGFLNTHAVPLPVEGIEHSLVTLPKLIGMGTCGLPHRRHLIPQVHLFDVDQSKQGGPGLMESRGTAPGHEARTGAFISYKPSSSACIGIVALADLLAVYAWGVMGSCHAY